MDVGRDGVLCWPSEVLSLHQASEVAHQTQDGHPATCWGRAPSRQLVVPVCQVSEGYLFVIFNVHGPFLPYLIADSWRKLTPFH